jgi:DNA-binding transcriptional ArsR family regulator
MLNGFAALKKVAVKLSKIAVDNNPSPEYSPLVRIGPTIGTRSVVMPPRRARQSKKSSRETAFDTQLIKALSHPVRARALAILSERVASPKEIADELEIPLGNVSYHVNTLREFGCIELVEEVPRRGATEHFYRGVARSFLNDENWSKLDPTSKGGISVSGLKAINKHARRALEAGTFDSRDDRHLSYLCMSLDQEGWREMSSLLAEALERLADINAKAANRMAVNGDADGAISAIAALLGFESPPQTKRKAA